MRKAKATSTQPFWLRLLRQNLPLVIFLALALAGMLAVYWYFSPAENNEVAAITAVAANGEALTAPIHKSAPAKPVRQRLAQSQGPLRIGIISGHKGNDSGAVCADGLTEAEVNANIAEKLAASLNNQGIRTEVLDEFDPRLPGYSATALISIHADSCQYINDLATGFKISGSSFTDSSQLSICVEEAYQQATGLTYHANTITADMSNYHAFREIAPGTPAIIIEVGFMNLDRALITTNADRPVQGLTNGVLCYLGRS